jgi:methanethiol S-methyltransferase
VKRFTDPRVARLMSLIRVAVRPPAGVGRIIFAIGFGIVCHTLFAASVLAMIAAMFFGLSESLGTVPWPWAGLTNAALIVQFPVVHSLLLTGVPYALPRLIKSKDQLNAQ